MRAVISSLGTKNNATLFVNTHNERSPRFEGSFFVTPSILFGRKSCAMLPREIDNLALEDWKGQKSADRADRVDHSPLA